MTKVEYYAVRTIEDASGNAVEAGLLDGQPYITGQGESGECVDVMLTTEQLRALAKHLNNLAVMVDARAAADKFIKKQ